MKKVMFHEEACIAEHFEAVLKTYRILRPNSIELENQELCDEHLILLVKFMKNLEMIKSINLRKNKIGNAGAKAFADFITDYDSTLIEVDLNRNYIEEEGAQKLIDAIHKTIRIEKFQMGFGNLISGYLVNAFD